VRQVNQAPGKGLPEPFRSKLHSGGWLGTAHGGLTTVAPANSRRAIVAAITLGVDIVEVDVHRTIDEQLVLHHDRDVRVGAVPMPIVLATLRQLKAVDLGQDDHIITLAEAMDIVRGRAGLFVDVKADGLARAIVTTARQFAFTPLIVGGIFRETLTTVAHLDPAIGTSLTLLEGWPEAYGAEIVERADTPALTVDHTLLDPSFIERCHTAGRAVLAWTVDDLPRMRELLSWGVDGITSNRPDLFVRV